MTELPVADVQAIWKQACASLQLQLSPAVYNTWIMSNPLTNIKVTQDNQTIGVITSPTAFHATNIQKNLRPHISQAIAGALGKTIDLEFTVGDPVAAAQGQPSQTAETVNAAQSAPTQSSSSSQAQAIPTIGQIVATNGMTGQTLPSTPQSPPSYQSPAQPASPSQSTGHNFSPRNNSVSPRVEDLFSPSNLQASVVDKALFSARNVGLRLDYTFNTFAVSTTNEMAHAAALAVSNRPGEAYNPLFLYGGVGVGKTHLMHAIGNNILKNNPELRILYCSGEEFTNEIVSAIQTKKGLRFKEKYRTAQVLLIDDVQFIAGKNAVQEEFFHTFNALIKQSSQVVLTSDRPPHEINLLEDRLRSRFEAGLMIDIQQPTFELRTAILLIKAQASNLNIPMDLAQVIASKVDSARKIEGIIKTIRSEVELKKREINAQLIDELLQNEIDKKKQVLKVSPNDILRAVANHYHVKQTAMKGQRRVQALVRARHVAMYLLKEELDMPLAEIGRWFSNRDHTSALHATRKIEQDLRHDDMLQRDVSALRMSLTAISR